MAPPQRRQIDALMSGGGGGNISKFIVVFDMGIGGEAGINSKPDNMNLPLGLMMWSVMVSLQISY